MPNYVPTDWADGITPVDEAHLDKIEQGIVAAVPRHGQAATGTYVFRSYYPTGDVEPVVSLNGDGAFQWGPGGSTPVDTALWRSSAGQLTTSGSFSASQTIYAGAGQIVNNISMLVQAGAEAAGANGIRWLIRSHGHMEWGPGDGTLDANLYRLAANALQTNGTFCVGGALSSGTLLPPESGWAFHTYGQGDAGVRFLLLNNGRMHWGNQAGNVMDTNLYRVSPGNLKTDGSLQVAFQVMAGSADAPDMLWAFTTQAAGDVDYRWGVTNGGQVRWGDGTNMWDTRLYRWGAGSLRLDGGLSVRDGVIIDANIVIGTGFTSGGPSQIQGNTDIVWNKATLYFIDQAALPYTWSIGAGPGQSFSIGDQVRGASVLTFDKTGIARFIGPQLTVDGALLVGNYSSINYGSVNQIIVGDVSLWLGAPANRPGLILGNGFDTALYRHQPFALRTNSRVIIEGGNDPGAFVLQSRDALTLFTASRSRIGIGDSVPGAANPAIHFFRTASGTDENGIAARIMSQGDGLRFQVADSYALYGAETYTDALRIDLAGQTHLKSTLYFGAASDAAISWGAAGYLQTGGLWATGDIIANTGGERVALSANATIFFGNAYDTKLYREGANALKTDGSLRVMGTLFPQGSWSLQSFMPGDVALRVGIYNPGSAIYFGPGTAAEDTSLARLSPGVLGINGVAIPMTGGGAGTKVLISEQTLVANSGSGGVISTAIPAGYREIEIIIEAVTTGPTNGDILVYTFDPTPSPGGSMIGGAAGQGDGSGYSPSMGPVTLGRSMYHGVNGTNDYIFFARIEILPGYDAAHRHAAFYRSIGHRDVAGNNNDVGMLQGGVQWPGSSPFSAMTGFNLKCQGGQGFGIGSKIIVYGVK